MSNLTMCTQEKCPLSTTCLRFTPNKSQYAKQNYLAYDPRESDGYCPMYEAPNQLNLTFA